MFQPTEHALRQDGFAIFSPAEHAHLPRRGGAFVRSLARLGAVDLTVDLGARIGSRAWFRGAATCIGLCWTAIHFAPGFEPLATPAAPTLADATWQESRALALAPIAFGGDTGRRMAATAAVQPLAGAPERPSIDLTATLGLGDGFAHVLTRAGASESEARRVATLVAAAVPLDSLKPGTRIDMTLGRRGDETKPRPIDFLRFRAAFDMKLAINRAENGLRLVREPIPVDNSPLRITGMVGTSLFHSARAAGASGKVIAQYLRAVAQRMSLDRDIGATARFDMIVAQRRAATGEVETGELLYAGLEQGPAKRLQMLRWTGNGRNDWFDAAGIGPIRDQPVMPVNGVQTSSFGMRNHPILGYSRMHQGLDIGAPYGAPVVSSIDGMVTWAARHGGHGNFVQVYANKAFGTGYAHLSRIAVRSGDFVRRGQVIGYVGSSGLSTGPHLHYEIYRNGQPINPLSVSMPQADQLTGAEYGQFRVRMANLLTVRPAGQMTSPVRNVALITAKPVTRLVTG